MLVIVTLYGGNDGINTVIPYADNAYHDVAAANWPSARRGAPARRPARAQPGAQGPRAGVERQEAGHRARRRAIRSPTTATSGRWTSGRPPRRPSRSRPAGSAAGSTPPATTRCARSTSARYCRHWPSAKSHTAAALSTSKEPQPADEIHRHDGRARADDPNDTPAMAAVCDAYRATRTTDTTFAPGDSSRPPATARPAIAGRPAGHGGRGSQGRRCRPGCTRCSLGGFDTHADGTRAPSSICCRPSTKP